MYWIWICKYIYRIQFLISIYRNNQYCRYLLSIILTNYLEIFSVYSEKFSQVQSPYSKPLNFVENLKEAWNLCQLVAIDHIPRKIAIPRERTELRTVKTVSPVSRTLHLLAFLYPTRGLVRDLCMCCARETRSINGRN